MRTLHGVMTNGFPNLFIISNSQAGFTTNFPHAMDETSQHIGYILNECKNENLTSIEVSREAEDKWVEEIIGYLGLQQISKNPVRPAITTTKVNPIPKASKMVPMGKVQDPTLELLRLGERKEIWPESSKKYD